MKLIQHYDSVTKKYRYSINSRLIAEVSKDDAENAARLDFDPELRQGDKIVIPITIFGITRDYLVTGIEGIDTVIINAASSACAEMLHALLNTDN